MAAEFETGFFYKEPAWHGLGTVVDKVLTAEEAIKAAGLDWTVEMAPLYHRWDGKVTKLSDRVAVRRETDGAVLGVVTPGYRPIQNVDSFNFFDGVTASGAAKYHTAGSLRGGKIIWILAKLDQNGPLNIKGDQVDKYLLLKGSHDGSGAQKMFFTGVRVVCMNTLQLAESGARSETFYARHQGNVLSRMEIAQKILGLSLKHFNRFQEIAIKLATDQLPPAQMPLLLNAAFGTSGAISADQILDMNTISTRRKNEFEVVTALFEGMGKGLDNPKIKGTKWAAYNAVVEYVDYHKKFHGEKGADNRLDSVWTSTIKNRAWNFVTKA